jgi:hypothetical protein
MVASHKYVKREGSAGNYKYFYKEHKKSPEGTVTTLAGIRVMKKDGKWVRAHYPEKGPIRKEDIDPQRQLLVERAVGEGKGIDSIVFLHGTKDPSTAHQFLVTIREGATDKGISYAEDHPMLHFPYKTKNTVYTMTKLGLYLTDGKNASLFPRKTLNFALTRTEGLFDRKKGTLTDPITKAKYSVDPVLIDSLAELTRS